MIQLMLDFGGDILLADGTNSEDSVTKAKKVGFDLMSLRLPKKKGIYAEYSVHVHTHFISIAH